VNEYDVTSQNLGVAECLRRIAGREAPCSGIGLI